MPRSPQFFSPQANRHLALDALVSYAELTTHSAHFNRTIAFTRNHVDSPRADPFAIEEELSAMRYALLVILLVLAAVAAYILVIPADRPLDPLGSLDGSPESQKDEILEAMAESDSYPFDFSLVSTQGQTVSRQDFAGKVLVVDIWGTWCPPCRAGIPHFVELQDEYREEGLSIVGINYENGTRDDALAAIEEFTSEIPINYPLLIGDEATKDRIPGFQGYPTTLFIDRDGKVRLTLVGARPKAELEAIVQVLLETPAPQGSQEPADEAAPEAELEST